MTTFQKNHVHSVASLASRHSGPCQQWKSVTGNCFLGTGPQKLFQPSSFDELGLSRQSFAFCPSPFPKKITSIRSVASLANLYLGIGVFSFTLSKMESSRRSLFETGQRKAVLAEFKLQRAIVRIPSPFWNLVFRKCGQVFLVSPARAPRDGGAPCSS